MESLGARSRSQVGIGTLAVFIAMVLVAVLAGGVLLETTGFLQGKSAATGQQSSSQVTDRVGIESATASYSSGNMQRIDVVLSKAPGSGDIDLSRMVVHWLGPNGSTELTESTFSITSIKGSGTVLEERSDRLQISNFGKTIPDGTTATVRFITVNGGTTTVILHTPNAPPTDGDVSLLWQSPTGNPANGAGSAIKTATSTPTATPTPSGPSSTIKWTYRDHSFNTFVAESGSPLFAVSYRGSGGDQRYFFEEIDSADGSSVKESAKYTNDYGAIAVDSQGRPVAVNRDTEDVLRWDPDSNSTTTLYDHSGDGLNTFEVQPYSGDIYLTKDTDVGEIERRRTDGTIVWERSNSNDLPLNLAVTGSAVYYDDGTYSGHYLKKRDHSGALQWSEKFAEAFGYLHAGSGDYLYMEYNSAVRQVWKSNGSLTSFAYSTTSVTSIDTDQAGYVYLAEGSKLTILDPTDASVVYTREFDSSIDHFSVRSDGVYRWNQSAVVKLEVNNLP